MRAGQWEGHPQLCLTHCYTRQAVRHLGRSSSVTKRLTVCIVQHLHCSVLHASLKNRPPVRRVVVSRVCTHSLAGELPQQETEAMRVGQPEGQVVQVL